MKTIEYTYRGRVERGNGRGGYVWRDGYSGTAPDGGILYPWNTYRECQREAKARECRAVFKRA